MVPSVDDAIAAFGGRMILDRPFLGFEQGNHHGENR
jgi:hypothetical protein